MFSIFYISVFVLGLIVGSFINVLVARYSTGISPLKGRSMCFSCGKNLSWTELIPVFSFIYLKARCKGCGSKISFAYPLVELITGIVFLSLYLKSTPSTLIEWLSFLFYLIIFSSLVALSSYDIRHKIIPNEFSYGFAVSTLIFYLIFNFSSISLTHLLAGPLLAFCFYALWVITRGRGIGLGDAKLSLGIGWLLGMSSGISAILVSFWVGAIVSLVIMATEKVRGAKGLTMKSEVPFGPYLVIGTFSTFLFEIDFATISSWLSFGL